MTPELYAMVVAVLLVFSPVFVIIASDVGVKGDCSIYGFMLLALGYMALATIVGFLVASFFS